MPESTVQNIYTQERLPAWVQPYYENLATMAQDEAVSSYTPYQGQRLAGFTGLENAAMAGIGALGMSGGPLQQRYATQALQGGLGGLAGYQPQFQDVYGRAGQVPMSTGVDWQQYMNPYTRNVTDIAEREARRFGEQQRSEVGSRAAQAGAFGGYRHGLQEQAIDRGVRQDISDLRVRGQERAFDRGLGMFMSDRDAAMAGRGQQLAALQGGIGAFGTLGGLAGQMGGLGAQEQAMQLERLGAMEGAGTRQRAMQQAGLDIGYQDFQNQRNFPRESLSWFSSILGGFPHQSMGNTNQAYQQNVPGMFQGMLGTGISGLGTYYAMGGFGQ